MELRPGYKQTDVGLIPVEWEVKRIGSLATVSSGGTPSRKNSSFWGGSIPWVTTSQINFGIITEANEFITQEGLNYSAAKLLPAGTLLLALYGQGKTRGKVGMLGFEAATNQACASISVIGNMSRDYLLYFLSSRYDAIRNSSNSGSQENLNGQIVKDFLVICPTVAEQRAIAGALSDVDALISGLEQLIAKKRDLRQAAMQKLLTGQTRLPGFSGDWALRPLASVVSNLEAGVSVNSVEHGNPLDSGEPCILKTSAIFDGKFNPEECKLIDRQDIGRAKLSPRRDTIIISRMNTPNLVGEVGYVPADFPTINLPDRLWMTRFSPGADIFARWLAYMMSSSRVKESIKGLATGTSGSMKNIGKSALLALQLRFPAVEEQTAIATILSDMDADLAALEARLDKTLALKHGMMQELLTGRIRLINANGSGD